MATVGRHLYWRYVILYKSSSLERLSGVSFGMEAACDVSRTLVRKPLPLKAMPSGYFSTARRSQSALVPVGG